MSSMDISRVLNEMRALQARVAPLSAPRTEGLAAPPQTDFAAMMKSSVDRIAGMQNQAQALATAYESGDKSIDLSRVMLEVQKAGLAFRAMTEVRNKLVDAYREVMNMQV